MAISPRNALTDAPQARFFLAPETPQQRQYEALRAYYVERSPSQEVARRFGYSPGSSARPETARNGPRGAARRDDAGGERDEGESE